MTANAAWSELSDLTRRFRAGWKQFLAVHVAINVLIFTILTPAAGLLLRLAVQLSGSNALSDQDILFFALSPAGAVSLLVLGSLFAGFNPSSASRTAHFAHLGGLAFGFGSGAGWMLAIVLMDHMLRHRAQNLDVDLRTPVIPAATDE